MAFQASSTVYCSSAKYAAVTAWATGATIAAGALRRQSATPTVNNERVFIAIVGGTTHATTEPTWTFSRGDKIVDNASVTWQECTGNPAVNGDFTNTPNWTNGAKSSTVSQGHMIKDGAGTHLFIASIGGSAGSGAEPTWNTAAVGNTTVDNAVTWVYIGTSFANWAAPHARTQNMLSTGWGDGTVLKFYVGHDNAETQTTGINWARRGTSGANEIDILCVSTAGSMPPVAADLSTAGTVTCTGTTTLVLGGAIRICYGLQFTAGFINMNGDNSEADKNYEQCRFTLGVGATSGADINMGNNNGGRLTLVNPIFKFSNTAQFITAVTMSRIEGGSIDGAGSIPTKLFQNPTKGCHLRVQGMDLSNLLTTAAIVDAASGGNNCTYDFFDCKMNSAFIAANFFANGSSQRATFSRCSGSAQNWQFISQDDKGKLSADIKVIRTGGAIEDTQAFSWKIVTTTTANLGNPYESAPIAEYNTVINTNRTLTVAGIVNGAAVPTNAEMFMTTNYPGSATDTQATRASTRVADFLVTPASLTADSTSAWDSLATARANTTAYVLGDIIKLASNPGRIFFCTTAGTTAGSEPGGYASAVDGGSVTDNSAVFRAGCRFTMALTLSAPQPKIAGNIYVYVYAAKLSTTYFIDPFIAIT